MNNVYLLLELARWDRSGRVLQTLTCASKPLYLYLKRNKNVCAALRDSWLFVQKTSTSTYYDWCLRLHRLDGQAVIDDNCGEIWFCRGAPHRADGPAHSLTNTWIHHGLVLYTDRNDYTHRAHWTDEFLFSYNGIGFYTDTGHLAEKYVYQDFARTFIVDALDQVSLRMKRTLFLQKTG
jgi:hypothetical protein